MYPQVERCIRCQVLHQICHGVAFDLHGSGAPWETGSRCGINTGGMVNKVGCESRILNLVILQIPCQLVDDGTDHFQMAQLFRADVGQ